VVSVEVRQDHRSDVCQLDAPLSEVHHGRWSTASAVGAINLERINDGPLLAHPYEDAFAHTLAKDDDFN
jgi:hypothetical protein